jgi:hypothetical protein
LVKIYPVKIGSATIYLVKIYPVKIGSATIYLAKIVSVKTAKNNSAELNITKGE